MFEGGEKKLSTKCSVYLFYGSLCLLFDGCLFCSYPVFNKLCTEICACPLFLCDQLDGCSLRGGLAPQPGTLGYHLHNITPQSTTTGSITSMNKKSKWKVKQQRAKWKKLKNQVKFTSMLKLWMNASERDVQFWNATELASRENLWFISPETLQVLESEERNKSQVGKLGLEVVLHYG